MSVNVSRGICLVVALLLVTSSVGAVTSSIHSTDSEFSSGTLSGLQVAGSGDDATIEFAPAITHTTDTDFQDGTLTSAEIVGSGESASVEANFGGEAFADDFEDQDFSEWDNSWSITSTEVVQGSYAAETSSTTNLKATFAEATPTTWVSYRKVPSPGDTYWSRARLSDTDIIRYEITSSDDFVYYDGGSAVSSGYSPNGNWIKIIVEDIDYSANTYAIRVVEVSSGDTVVQDSGLSFQSSASGLDMVEIGGRGGQQYLDGVSFGTGSGGTAQYLSGNHTADLSQPRGWVDLSLSDAEATVEWQAWDSSAGSWSVVNSTTYTTGGKHYLDISDSSATTWRTNVTFNGTGGSPSAALHAEGIESVTGASYLSQPHPVENATSLYLAATLENASLNATVEGYDSSASSWKYAGSVTRNTTTFDTYNVTSGYSEYRTRITVSKTDAPSSVAIHAEGVSAGGTTIIEETTTTTTTTVTDQQTLVEALRPTQANKSLVTDLLSAQVAGQRGKVDRIIHEILVRLGLAQRDVTAAKAATSAEDYYNSRSDEFTAWMNTQSADSNVNLTETDTVQVNFTVNGETETRYLIGLVDGDRLATTTVVRSTNRTVDHSVNLTGFAAADATNQLERIYEQSVRDNQPVTLAQQEAMRERYGPDISTTLWNTTATDSASA
ncbi:hypothetical protein C5C07_20280 [Haloferax sp. Atlit-4N]|uniref:hypothetical protein n=1 Tax=Haloferax sp. Atlit-4N TaxID=2077206 RepID=UPI000E231050|nr:hypothetical protein [Haloferax sp. Atlit-4N]RDZ49522.1 hypothetical protein C5C07_20280 [Haloferax sp. Atlit-4N]